MIRQGVRAMSAMNQTTVPWCSVIIRNAFGVAGAAHQPAGGSAALRLAVGPLGLAAAGGRHRGGLSRRDRRGADPKAKLAEIEDRLNQLRSPFRTAETFWVEEIIDPATRAGCSATSPAGGAPARLQARAGSACGLSLCWERAISEPARQG